MRLILAGIGSFGIGWYQILKADPRHFDVAVADPNPAARERLSDPGDRFYTSFEEALEKERPDFVVNVTPPDAHLAVDRLAFRAGLPVLSEKPIAAGYTEAAQIVALAQEYQVHFMIAENYRRAAPVRKLRQLIARGAIGQLAAVRVFFAREFTERKAYLLAMSHPLLVDVAVHHLDMLRYLTREEGLRVQAQHYRPLGSAFPGCMGSLLYIEMTGGIVATYDGSMSAKGRSTVWPGSWRIEGTEGVLELVDNQITLTHGEESTPVSDLSDAPDTHSVLDEFLRSLAEGRPPETSGEDYLKTQRLVDLALC
jgi:predicted dehydrogenase